MLCIFYHIRIRCKKCKFFKIDMLACIEHCKCNQNITGLCEFCHKIAGGGGHLISSWDHMKNANFVLRSQGKCKFHPKIAGNANFIIK